MGLVFHKDHRELAVSRGFRLLGYRPSRCVQHGKPGEARVAVHRATLDDGHLRGVDFTFLGIRYSLGSLALSASLLGSDLPTSRYCGSFLHFEGMA